MLDEQSRSEISMEMQYLAKVCTEVQTVLDKSSKTGPDNILKAALGTYLAQFYNGIENILKRIVKARSITLPKSEQWHRELFLMFCENGHPDLPVLFKGKLFSDLTAFRKFRHVVFHGYSFTLDWETITSGAGRLNTIFNDFKQVLKDSNLLD